MPPRKDGNRPTDGEASSNVSSHEKIARLLAFIVTKDMEQIEEKVGRLSTIGFSNSEIAAILGITTNHVGVALHKYKKHGASKLKKE